jgi:glycosyltransferase involved in cell wall biosynthesis
MNAPTVTCIIPTLGRSSLVNAVISALNQTHNCSIIVVVDRNYKELHFPKLPIHEKIKVIYSTHTGVSELRNEGIRNAKTDFVAFLDDDDLWLPEKIEIQLSYAELGCHLISCQSVFQHGNRIQLKPRKNKHNKVSNLSLVMEKFYNRNLFGNRNYIPVSSWMIDRKILQNVCFDPSYSIREDLKLLYEIEGSTFISVDKPLVWIKSSRIRSWNRENLREAITWFKFLSVYSRNQAIQFLLFEYSRTVMLRTVIAIFRPGINND